MPDEYIQILYDHYKDTFSIIEKIIAKRQKNFILSILLVIATVILTLNPELVLKIVQGFGKEKLKTDLGLTYFH